MGRGRQLIGAVIGAVIGLVIAGPAGAATSVAPGMLTAVDLPSGYQQPAGVQTFPTFNLAVTDAATCTESPKPVSAVLDARLVSFSPPGAPTTTPGLSESVLTFPDPKTAKLVFTARAANEAVRYKCGSVGFLAPGGTTPLATLHYAKSKVPKTGSGSYATTGAATSTGGSISATFVSGPYLVGLSFAGDPYAPSASELKSILKNAQRRLTQRS